MPRVQLTKKHTGFVLAKIAMAALAAWPISSAHGVTTSWNTNSSGSFTSAANWNNGVPHSEDTAVFNRGPVAYTVTFPGGSVFDPSRNYVIDYLRVQTNEVTFAEDRSPFIISASLSVVNPDVSIVVGQDAGEVAILNTTLSSLSGANASIGRAAGAEGTLNIRAGTIGGLVIGDAGTGTMNVSGGRVESLYSSLGLAVNSQGRVTVSGAGSTWTSGELDVGDAGAGTLTIEAGGSISSSYGRIGSESGSTGTVTVTGAGSTWINNGELFVGFRGTGALTIEASGSISSSNGRIGSESGSTGTVTVSGAGSIWTNKGVFVGYSGTGALTIETGGSVFSDGGSAIGGLPGSLGAVTVTGAASRWINNGALYVGYFTTGTLTIGAGGSVMNDSAFIGRSPGSGGIVTVSGAGANWSIGQRLSIGGDSEAGVSGGTGVLVVQPGSRVEVAQDIVIFSNGQVRLEGGELAAASIGFQGTGQFQMTSGTLHVDAYNGNLTNSGGKLAPGRSPGSTTIIGNYTQQGGGALQIEIGGTAPGGTHDRVNIFGNAVLGGQLQLAMLGGFLPTAANAFTVLNAAGGVSGTFSNVTSGQRLATIDGVGSFIVNYGPGSAFNQNQIVLSSFQLGADFDENGMVNGADLLKWKSGFGASGAASHMDGDADGDLDVDGADFLTWQRQLGSPAATAATIPEQRRALWR